MFSWNPMGEQYGDNQALSGNNFFGSNPSGIGQFQMNPPPTPNEIRLPRQQITTANGKQSIDKIKMWPGSSAIIADTTASRVWFCFSDGIGNVKSTPYKIVPETLDEPAPQQQVQSQTEIPNSSLTQLEERMSVLENLLLEMEDKLNGKSNTTTTESKSNGYDHGASQTTGQSVKNSF